MSSISPLDSRYKNKIFDVIKHFSDYNFSKYKYKIEVSYLKFFLIELIKIYDRYELNLSRDIIYDMIESLMANYNNETYNSICENENITNHDIQALINVIKIQIPKNLRKWVHFGLTSQDINSPAMVLMYKNYIENIFYGDIRILKHSIKQLYIDNFEMLSFTHGQPATPIMLKNMFSVHLANIENIILDLYDHKWTTKMGGSNGQLSALRKTFPTVNWEFIISKLLRSHSLSRNMFTTQIDNYSNYFKLFQILERFCYILINFCQDIWLYCSKEYFVLKNIKDEVGSSAMPHKINPIQFENAEGNLKLSASIYHTIGQNICLCRLQRDLTDSTLLRNVGVACGHLTLAIRNIGNGLNRISINKTYIQADLNENSIIKMEYIQLFFRKWGIENGYDVCKEFSRGKKILNIPDFFKFLENKDIVLSDENKKEIEKL